MKSVFREIMESDMPRHEKNARARVELRCLLLEILEIQKDGYQALSGLRERLIYEKWRELDKSLFSEIDRATEKCLEDFVKILELLEVDR
jgi:hypothetical protein